MFTVQDSSLLQYKTHIEFDLAIRTDSIEKQTCRTTGRMSDKLKVPFWHFVYDLDNTMFARAFEYPCKIIPNEIFENSKIKFTGLSCLDVDSLSQTEINDIKDLCKIDDNIKYCAKSVSGNGLFILYDVGISNQTNTIKLYKEIFPKVTTNLLSKVRKNIKIDPISLSVLTARIESYDPEPYNNFGDRQW